MISKKDFFDIYYKVVNYEIPLDSLDDQTLLQIETMLKEELKLQKITIKKLNDKLKKNNI